MSFAKVDAPVCICGPQLAPPLINVSSNQIEYALISACPGQVCLKEGGDKGTILILHGAPGAIQFAIAISGPFINAGYNALVISRPGYGQSPLGDRKTPAQQADSYIKLLDELSIATLAAVVAFSAGCDSALYMALNYPTRLRVLVLQSLGVSPGALSGPFVTFINNSNNTTMAIFVAASIQAPEITVRTITSNDSTQFNFSRSNFILKSDCQMTIMYNIVQTLSPIENQLAGFNNDLVNSAQHWGPGFTDFPFAKISVPTLVISATTDSSGSFTQAVEVVHLIPCSELIALPHSGHLIMLGPSASDYQAQIIKRINKVISKSC